MDRLTAAKVFVDVATTGSFTVTADRLNMSRPMVTRYIETMEAWLNTRLLHRTTRKVSLTTAGETCLEEVKQWLGQAESLSGLSDTSGELSGTVRLATSMSFGYSQLVPAIQEFMAENPKVKIDIDLQDSVTDLTERQIDLAIRIASAPDPSLIGKPISVCESVVVASPLYLTRNSTISEPSDLTNHTCLGYKNFEQHIWHLTKDNSQQSVEVRCNLTANETTTLLHAVLCGAGIAIQPTYLANQYVKSGQLQQVLPNWKPNDLTIYALYSSRKYMSPTVRTLIDYLSDYFAETRW
ncbi:LysR family transcriptional regulator [Vibrio genomosp. F10]|uniref:LysR family transcriptional regulator n=2 Tax=Vibrio genomosp. F10 TaxID=723171 RepID=A0A1B9QVE7_9VIBR|nr:LysR family transcriptional regulator [Vibrio genomosp. F10]OCH72918.1 LysR family transcriptional regulator [Vibrio genomosp. F10]OEE35943.1 LysR family transcriptional regulator [Vibrio genomosp. F10 str. ZF-129]